MHLRESTISKFLEGACPRPPVKFLLNSMQLILSKVVKTLINDAVPANRSMGYNYENFIIKPYKPASPHAVRVIGVLRAIVMF